jgi:hypothetical protein
MVTKAGAALEAAPALRSNARQHQAEGQSGAMKITIEVDCTPAEARAFMGLPDVEPLQAEVMAEIQRRVMQGLAMTDPQQLLKTWAPWGTQSMEAFQNFMRSATSGSTGSKSSRDEDPPHRPKPRG